MSADDRWAREWVIASLEQAGIPMSSVNQRATEYLNGQDFSFAELELDSLAFMELCIALEVEFDVSLSPEDVMSMGTLATLARRLVEQRE